MAWFPGISTIRGVYNILKEKTDYSGNLKIRQEHWQDSPCSRCQGTPCCRNLPLAPGRLESQRDFINLTMASVYNGLFPAMKDSGEWTYYLSRSCSFLSSETGMCTIHKELHQSLICKTYDAHSCWYTDAFNSRRYTTMIPFNTERLIWLEKRYDLIRSRFASSPDWETLCRDMQAEGPGFEYPVTGNLSHALQRKLTFKKSRSSRYLLFPPYKRPGGKNHFELLSFRLGFPGVSLALSDTTWAFLVETEMDPAKLDLVRREYYPAIEHKDGNFSFDSIVREYSPYSETGEQWVLLHREDLPTLTALTEFDASGRIKRLPSCAEILHSLQPSSPNRVA